MIGKTISHYEILEKLGEGGMGVVYKAFDTKLDRHVAIKFLPPHLKTDEQAKKRFVHEAKAASALNHANIAVVHDINETPEGQMFIVMAYYEGQTLKDRTTSGAFNIDEAVAIVSQIASGLSAAHERGILHRDVKPANVLLGTDGQAKLADFGLAKLTGQTKVTKTGTTVGTVAYMSPEQASGGDIDHRSDVFSLGVVLYELITGSLPFRGDHEAAVLYGIMNSEPEPLTHYRSDVPNGLQYIVKTALQKNKDARYPSAADMSADLARLGTGDSKVGYTKSRPKRTRSGILAISVSLIVLTSVLLFYLRYLSPRSGTGSVGNTRIVVLPFKNLGPPADDYFASGLTEEITSRLASVRDLGVIGRTSAIKYVDTDKTVEEIGDDLNVDYALDGTVRWDGSGTEKRRIRVTPQLIDVSNGTQIWSERYDRVFGDVFGIQSDIASQVVSFLKIAVSTSEREILETLPTESFDAYQAYLAGLDQESVELAILMFERAVQLDPRCVPCYAKLSQRHLGMYHWWMDRTERRLADAKAAADSALALGPANPDAQLAIGYYYYWGLGDYDRALVAFNVAEQGRPNDGRIFSAKAFVWRRQGRFEDCLEAQKRALELSPLDAELAGETAVSYMALRQYEDAERLADREISLAPDKAGHYLYKARIQLLRGDLKGHRETLETLPAQYDAAENWFWHALYEKDYNAALEALQATSRDAFPTRHHSRPKELLAGFTYELMGDTIRARAFFDSARVRLEKQVDEQPDDHRHRGSLGLSYAGLGRKRDAIREGKLGMELMPESRDAFDATAKVMDLALIYCMVGEYELAINELDHLFSMKGPGYIVSAPLLRLDPRWDPVRGQPRFQALLEKYSDTT